LKETADPIRWPHIDDVIVALHNEGENVFQASARATLIPEATSDFIALLVTLAETGRVLLASGETIKLPRLDNAGVAEICNFELGCADYDANRVMLERPLVEETRIPSSDLWPALRANGYRVSRDDPDRNDDVTPLARLAETTPINYTRLHRIAAGTQNTVRISDAFTLLMRLGYDEHARDLENVDLEACLFRERRVAHEELELEYLEALTRFAQQARCEPKPWLKPNERQALADILWISEEAQRESFLGTTPGARLTETLEVFRTEHRREPVGLSRRLHELARRMFDNEAKNATESSRQLRKGLHTRKGPMTASAVAMRTHRLRREGRLPPKSRPKPYTVTPAE
jgi:hypothetical protein